MGCFLGCFGGEKDRRRRKQRGNRGSPQRQRNKVQNVQQENVITAEKSIAETPPSNLVSELGNKPEGEEKLSPSPRKRVTFNSNITTYEHVSVHESIESLPDHNTYIENEKQENSKTSSQSHSISEDENSVISSVKSYPPNHRYHNARDSDDEAEEYGDDELDDMDDLDDEDDYDDYDEDKIDVGIAGQEVWSESVVIALMESTGNPSSQAIDQEVESPMVKSQPSNEKVNAFGSKTYARDRTDYINSVLNPVENITQWKAAKSQGTRSLKLQKENMTANFDPPRVSLSSEPTFRPGPLGFKSKSNENQEIAVDASLSNWLGSQETTPSKKTSFSGSEGCCTSTISFEDRPILGALTVEELRQISASNSPRKSPSRSPDEMPIIGTVGTYWNHSGSTKRNDSATSYNKYSEDKRVNWHSTPFETRLDRALKRETAEA